MQASVRTDSDALNVVAVSSGSETDPQHVEELLAAMAAQTDGRWRLELVTMRRHAVQAWQAMVDEQPDWLRSRVRVTYRPRWRRRAGRPGELRLRVDDVPLAHVVESVLGAGVALHLRAAVQDVFRVRWPSGVAGWSLAGPARVEGVPMLRIGTNPLACSADVVVLRRRWISAPP